MKILIAGLGSVGRRHLRNLISLGEKDVLLYRTHQSTLPPDELTSYPEETDLDRALQAGPDAVIVANPTSNHLDVAIPAARAGCSILLEKPISNSLERVDVLEQALQESGGKLLVGFQFRFHPTLLKILQLLRQGAIGRVLSFRGQYNEYLPGCHPWENYRQGFAARADLGGGPVLTFCHPLDYLRWMFGEVDSAWAFTGHLSDLELSTEDAAEIGLRLQNGIVGSLHLGYNQQPPSHCLEVVGTLGTMHWDNEDGILHLYRSEIKAWEEHSPPTGFERNDMFRNEMSHFLAVARGECEPECTLADGVAALQLSLAVHRSSKKGELVCL